jgi:hypothetical protein
LPFAKTVKFFGKKGAFCQKPGQKKYNPAKSQGYIFGSFFLGQAVNL